ncbi:hypothetical protein V8F33_009455 [Rhypophila sp. PSN 637]
MLLDMILAQLAAKDQARLARCNRELSQRTLHSLYKPDAGNSVVEWAVTKGAIDTLRRALARGALVSWVRQSHEDKPTLTLALQHKQDDTFLFLLELGASLPSHGRNWGQHEDFYKVNFRHLYNCLYTDRFDLVRRFIEARLASHFAQSMLNVLFLRIMERTLDIDVDEKLIEILLEDGADPNCVDYLPEGDTALNLPPQAQDEPTSSWSPLSHALCAGRGDLFQLLIEKGANINGPFPWQNGIDECRLPLHVPVCAAAFRMADADEDSWCMELCIEHGADLGIRVPYYDESRNMVSFITPPAVFLQSVEEWGEQEHPNLIEKLEFLLIHGALSPDTIKPEKPRHDEIKFKGIPFSPPESCFDWLMKQRDAESSSKDYPALLSALKLLIRHGTSIDSFTYSFRKYHVLYRAPDYSRPYLDDDMIRHPPSDTPPKEGFSREHWFNFWRELVDTLLDSPQYHQSLDFFLYVYILSKGPLLHQADAFERDLQANGDKIELFRQTVGRLVQGGANINRRGGIVSFRARLRDFETDLGSGDTVGVLCVHPPHQGCVCK